ncbi:MAG: hypothetical protein M4579_005803 [Chaenotheca gracillima]|nr:MAG: hypothetical protein M4579_005803 [Chaenotheca gracillima]
MPYDRHNSHPNNNATRPLMPTLSGGNKPSRPPLTPRLAGSSSSVSSPGPRRVAGVEETSTPKTNSKEDISTPVKAFLSTNITPRSSSRKAKLDSSSSTPNGTPNGTPSNSRPTSTLGPGATTPGFNSTALGLGLEKIEDGGNKKSKSIVSDGRSSANAHRSVSPERADANASRFFYANQAQPIPEPRGTSTNSKTTSFFYANGDGPDSTGLSPPTDRDQSKFFHINEMRGNSPGFVTSPGSVGLSSPGLSRAWASPTPQLSPGGLPAQFRPASPPKLAPASSNGSGRNVPTLSSPPVNRPIPSPMTRNAVPPPPVTTKSSTIPVRRSSIETASSRFSHGRSISVGSVDTTPPRRSHRPSISDVSSPISPTTTTITSLPPTSQTVPSPPLIPEEPEPEPDPTSNPGAQPSTTIPSPTTSTDALPIQQKTLQQLNEAAASARRERKVLDLEISNSSLLAINRTLEREMRKQSAELRRYRRLSRSGRLSLNSTNIKDNQNSRIVSDTSTRLSSLTEEPTSSDSDSANSSSSSQPSTSDEDDDDDDDANIGPSAQAASDARHRAKDEARLALDLAKHAQLLHASQAMNQSLKRCLGWTEELIGEGKKALEYRVRVSDVRLGGRVLPMPEVEPEGEHEEGDSQDVGEDGKIGDPSEPG